jgi:hypothetical protein
MGIIKPSVMVSLWEDLPIEALLHYGYELWRNLENSNSGRKRFYTFKFGLSLKSKKLCSQEKLEKQ